MCGPYHGPGRGAFASRPEILRRLLQLRQNASILEQGCAGFSPGSANRCDQFTRHPGRTSSPLRPSLSFRYRQRALKAKGVALRATEQPIDTSTAAGKAFLDMLGVFAEFETNLRKERQMEGIVKAKAAGVYKGRPPSVDRAKIADLKAQGFGPSQIARKLGIGRASVYRALEA